MEKPLNVQNICDSLVNTYRKLQTQPSEDCYPAILAELGTTLNELGKRFPKTKKHVRDALFDFQKEYSKINKDILMYSLRKLIQKLNPDWTS